MQRRHFFMSGVATLALALAACGNGNDDPTSINTTVPGSTSLPSGGPAELVARVGYSGGFVPVRYAFTQMPILSIYADGTVIVTGPQIEIYPGPALPNLLTYEVSDEVIADVREAARDLDLLRERDFGQPPIADAPDTVVTIVVDGVATTHAANALGIDGDDSTVSVEQRAARADLQGFIETASSLAVGTGDEQPYVAERFRLRTAVVDTSAAMDIEPTILDWAVADVDLAALVEGCEVVEGATADAVRGVFEQANELTWFTQGETTYDVFVRPLLPDETGC